MQVRQVVRGIGMVLVSLSLAGLLSCGAGDEDLNDSEEGCRAVVDHIVDLQLGSKETPDSDRMPELEKHRATLRGAVGNRVLADCKTRPTAHRECVLRAASAAELKECN